VETILIEVDRLGLTNIFMEDDANIRVVPHKYARKGNVIVCGYDKSETFLEVFGDDDGGKTPVVFFDDERVNIDIFHRSSTIARVITSLRNK
jgi:predicted ThiF/HesA family dinucleotide-utilizing enzyme